MQRCNESGDDGLQQAKSTEAGERSQQVVSSGVIITVNKVRFKSISNRDSRQWRYYGLKILYSGTVSLKLT